MIKLKIDDIIVNILPNPAQDTPERDLELLVAYVGATKEIFDNTKINKDVEN